VAAKKTAPSTRYQVRKGAGGSYVVDTRTGGTVMTGMVAAGARQVADHLNRRAF
jgi:sulfate adenylyltransferase subunit 1 (EFTu-like GTPase family)